MSEMHDYIEDGYTQPGYIAAAEGLHGPLEFEFRPALGKLADKITSLIQGDRPDYEAFWNAVAKALGSEPRLLQSWSLKDSKGQAVPINEAAIQRVRQLMVHKLWMIVSGHRPSDPRPDGSQPAKATPEADVKN